MPTTKIGNIDLSGPSEEVALRTQAEVKKLSHVGEAHTFFEEVAAGTRYNTKDIFKNNESRLKVFLSVWAHSAEYGAKKGAEVGLLLTAIPDKITGTGEKEKKFKSLGLIGGGLTGINIVTSGAFEWAGKGLGAIEGAGEELVMAVKERRKPREFFKRVAERSKTGGKILGKSMATVISGSTTAVATIARLPAAAIKFVSFGIGGLIGGTLGFFRAAWRAT